MFRRYLSSSKGSFSLVLLLFMSVISGITITLFLVLKSYYYFVSIQEKELVSYANALSGLRYARRHFETLSNSPTPLDFDDIRAGAYIQIQTLSFYVLKDSEYIYALSNSYDSIITALRCSYSTKNATLEFDSLSYFFEE